SACLPLTDRFSRRERSVYFCPLMKRRSRPERRAYPLFRTSSSAPPKWGTMWDFSEKNTAFGAPPAGPVRERFPPSPPPEANAFALLGTQPIVESGHAGL